MSKEFAYTTYIKSTPEKVWQAITTPEFTRQYSGHHYVSDWKKDSKWEMLRNKDMSVNVVGKVLESTPPKRLVLSWTEADKPSDTSQVAFDIEMSGEMVRLSVTHSELSDYMAVRISYGWPIVISGLKTLLETGHSLSEEWGGCKSNAA
jgi:uncharacterized protein YndB with AHSA1/START domain